MIDCHSLVLNTDTFLVPNIILLTHFTFLICNCLFTYLVLFIHLFVQVFNRSFNLSHLSQMELLSSSHSLFFIICFLKIYNKHIFFMLKSLSFFFSLYFCIFFHHLLILVLQILFSIQMIQAFPILCLLSLILGLSTSISK